MHAAGGFVVAGALIVRLEDLRRWEERRSEVQAEPAHDASATRSAGRSRDRHRKIDEIQRGWWRDDGTPRLG
jgi:hypothetical protein